MALHPSWDARPSSIRYAVIASTAADRVREPAVAIIDRLQYIPASVQLEALFAAATILASVAGLDPHDLVSRAKRQVQDLEAFDTDVLALAEYAKGELR